MQTIVIPIDAFNALIDRCSESYPEYQTLKNGFVMRNKGGAQEVHIPCDPAVAKTILGFAHRVCAEVSPHIRLQR